MKRVFEKKLNSLLLLERKIVTEDTITTQLMFDETTAEAEKRLKIKICDELLQKSNGEIKGYVYREYTDTIKELGWHSADEFIRERLQTYKEIKAEG